MTPAPPSTASSKSNGASVEKIRCLSVSAMPIDLAGFGRNHHCGLCSAGPGIWLQEKSPALSTDFWVEFQREILKANFEWAAGMQLQGEDSTTAAGRIIEVDAQLAVDRRSHAAADGHDFIFVPIFGTNMLFSRVLPQKFAAMLFVELSPPAGPHVGLITLDEAPGERLASKL